MKRGNFHLIWLNWAAGSFRLNARSLAVYRGLVPEGDEVRAVRTQSAFLRLLPQATHAVVWEFDRAWFARASRLRILATPGAGRELLPADDELPPGVERVNGEFHGRIMSETVVAFMFAHARGLYQAYRWQTGVERLQGDQLWPRAELSDHCFTVAGTRAVILGYGRIGHVIGSKLEALGVEVKGIRRANFHELRPALRGADWLIVCLPSDTGTDGVVNAAVLRSMKRTAVLVNVGRGNAVDEAALAAALKGGRLAGAYLDVFRREPLDASSPLAENLPGLVRLPHGSAFSPDYLPTFFRELDARGKLK